MPSHRPPTEAQLARILAILPEYDDGWSDDVEAALREDGYAHIKDASEVKDIPGMQGFDVSMMPGDRDVTYLAPLPEEGVLLRLDRSIYQEGNEEFIYNLEVFVYALEDRPAVEAALLHELAAKTLEELIGSLTVHCAPDRCVDVLRGALEKSPIGAVWRAEEAARMIKSSIDDENPENRRVPVIRKAGL